MAKPIHAFTMAYDGLSNSLHSKVTIGLAFDPKKTKAPAQFEFNSIWDTGATASVISERVIQKIGLQPTGMTKVHTAGGVFDRNTYLVSIWLPNNVGFPSVRVTEGELPNEDVLIGMDLIGVGDFAVSNFNGKTVFTYRTPSIVRFDFVKEIDQIKAVKGTSKKVGRNDPCPCGSGRKYKKCHGST